MYGYDDFYEPSEADLILREYQNKMRKVLLGSVKNEIEQLVKENEHLRKENEILRREQLEVRNKELRLQRKEEELEIQFYRKTFSEIIDPLLETYKAYHVEREWYLPEKCNKCNEDREIVYKSKCGDEVFQACDCSIQKSYLKPAETELEVLKLHKSYRSKEVIITPQYRNNSNDDVYWSTLNFTKVIHDLSKHKLEDIDRWKCVFANKEDCQKYCDYLNEKEKQDKSK